MRSRRGDINLTIKPLFAVFMVIFVVFITFEMVKTRANVLEQREHFDYYGLSTDFLKALLTSRCFSAEYNVKGMDRQGISAGYLSARKLMIADRHLREPECVENYRFMYTLEVDDSVNGRVWRIFMDKKPEWASRVVSVSVPVAIDYDTLTINPGRAILHAYIGSIGRFYGAIKEICNSHSEATFRLSNRRRVSYNNTENEFCYGSSCVYPDFNCRVNSFSLNKGSSLVYLKYNGNLTVSS